MESQLLRHDVNRVVDRAARVDTAAHTVLLESGRRLPYDHLVLATGSRTVIQEIPGAEGAYDFCTMGGAKRLFKALEVLADSWV